MTFFCSGLPQYLLWFLVLSRRQPTSKSSSEWLYHSDSREVAICAFAPSSFVVHCWTVTRSYCNLEDTPIRPILCCRTIWWSGCCWVMVGSHMYIRYFPSNHHIMMPLVLAFWAVFLLSQATWAWFNIESNNTMFCLQICDYSRLSSESHGLHVDYTDICIVICADICHACMKTHLLIPTKKLMYLLWFVILLA